MRPVLTICVAILLCAVSTPTALATVPPAAWQSRVPDSETAATTRTLDIATPPISRIGIPVSDSIAPETVLGAAQQTDPHPFITEFYSQDLPVVDVSATDQTSAQGATSNNP